MAAVLSWLRDFWKWENPGPTDPIVWHCRPLLIRDAGDKVVFKAQEIDVEYTPDAGTPASGVARIVNWDGPLPVPELAVREVRITGMETGGARSGFPTGREGVVLIGDYRGEPFKWYTDRRADEIVWTSRPNPRAG